MIGSWTIKINVTNLAKRIGTVTATRTETVEEVEIVWSRSLAKRRFVQSGKTPEEIRAELATEFREMYEQSVSKAALEAQITNQESLLADALNALET